MVKSRLESYKYIARQIKGARVVDVGCLGCKEKNLLRAYGYFAETAGEIVGIDINAAFIPKAKAKGVNVQLCDMQNPSQVDAFAVVFGTFDHVVSTETIEHVPNAGLFLENTKKLLAPGGQLHLATPNAMSPYWLGHMEKRGPILPHDSHIVWYCHRTLGSALREAGFKVSGVMHFADKRDYGWAERLGLCWRDWMGERLYIRAEVKR